MPQLDKVSLRQVRPEDEPFLWDMLYAAVFVPEGETRPPRSILQNPDLALYVADWGKRGDFGVIVEHDGQPIGAAWVRLGHGYGFVDDDTPELSMAVSEACRGQGIGTRLLEELFDHVDKQYAAISLSVALPNPARRLYERFGFQPVEQSGDSITMRRAV